MAEKILIVSTTFPDAESARRAASELVEARLAACAQVGGAIFSVYRWQGAVHSGAEYPLLLKTAPSSLEPLKARLFALHPYQCPQFVVLRAGASQDYAAWVLSSCAEK